MRYKHDALWATLYTYSTTLKINEILFSLSIYKIENTNNIIRHVVEQN